MVVEGLDVDLSCFVAWCWGEARMEMDGEGVVSVRALVVSLGECLVRSVPG